MNTKTITLGGVIFLTLLGACSKKPMTASTAAPPPPREPVVTASRQSDPAPTRTRQTEATPAPQPARNNNITAAEKARLDSSLAKLEDALFDFDKATIRPDAAKVLQSDVEVIRNTLIKYPSEMVTLEGHADQRGSAEYNLALGDARSKAVKEFLANLGVPGGQLNPMSMGKEQPQCTDENEACWQKNRRVRLVATTR